MNQLSFYIKQGGLFSVNDKSIFKAEVYSTLMF